MLHEANSFNLQSAEKRKNSSLRNETKIHFYFLLCRLIRIGNLLKPPFCRTLVVRNLFWARKRCFHWNTIISRQNKVKVPRWHENQTEKPKKRENQNQMVWWFRFAGSNCTIYYTHFEITGGPCNLICSNWWDLFTNRTIFCFKSHLFPSQWGGYTKKKQPIRF